MIEIIMSVGQKIMIEYLDDCVILKVLKVQNNGKVRLGITADKSVIIARA